MIGNVARQGHNVLLVGIRHDRLDSRDHLTTSSPPPATRFTASEPLTRTLFSSACGGMSPIGCRIGTWSR